MDLFSIISLLCHKINSLDEKAQNDLYKECCNDPPKVDGIIESQFPFFSKKERSVRLYNDLSKNQINRLKIYIEDHSPRDWWYLLTYLDGILSVEDNFNEFYSNRKSALHNVCYFESLSESSYGILIPKFKPKWAKEKQAEKQKSGSIPTEGLAQNPLSTLSEYIWIDNKMSDWNVTNVYCSEWNWNGSGTYTIVCSPLTDVPPFQYTTCDHDHRYYINYIDEKQSRIIERIEQTLRYAHKEQAEIVLFPELLASLEVQNQCVEFLQKNWGWEYPRIVCLPSSLYPEGDKWKNQTRVVKDSGELIFKYNKQNSFQLNEGDQTFFEPINNPDHKLYIIHIKGIGRIGVVICADIFNKKIIDVLFNKYKINLWLVISYTFGTDRFSRRLSIAQDYSCDVIWCNSCSAFAKKSKQKYVTVYFSSGHKECTWHKEKKCNNHVNCNGCAFSIKLSQKYEKSKKSGDFKSINKEEFN